VHIANIARHPGNKTSFARCMTLQSVGKIRFAS